MGGYDALPFFLLAALAAFPAQAQLPRASTPCEPRSTAMHSLNGKYNEWISERGITGAGALVEIWKTDDGKTWTITVTLPNGLTCMLAEGDNWEDSPQDKGKKS